ncbi:MAG: MBL fold metallo-hydrolase [Kofleriaceae bacterium]|nr:MBL fold metallo-hydrolase [Kofleriaceae bacterium]MBP9172605.1 MBL fold metallo-hydrolase [Kofleriaceae bacterium]MBP9861434.1 MBL fold metallo-hydrolase [Kofleriaceae bacterium]
MKLRFWGVRGSFAMCGKDFLRYGGNTTSVELVTARGGRLLIDLGTGATVYARHLMASEFGRGEGRLPVLLSHTHLDHIQGLPFFTPFFIKGNQIRILGVDPAGSSLKGTLQNQLAPHYSPLNGLENLAAGVSIETFLPGAELTVDDFEITTAALPHGTMWTTGFRIKADDKVVAFLSDVEYPAPHRPTREAFALAAGADLLIHDAMHDDDAYALARGWGHSPVSAGVHLARAAGAARLALFHHSPDATDAAIDRLVVTAAARANVPVFAAAEGEYLDV